MVGLAPYIAILRRRWPILVAIIALDVLVSGYLYRKAHNAAGFQACTTLYVADVTAPGMVSAADTNATAQLLAGESAANFFGDDINDVAQSQHVAAYVSARLAPRHLPNTSPSDIDGAVSASRLDRTLHLCVSNAYSTSALAAAQVLGTAMTSDRALFVGKAMAKRTFVNVISDASVGPASSSHALLNFGLRVILGVLLAIGLGLMWDALDPRVRDKRDLERTLGVPVLATLH
ncbi:MAG TPA: hypothetical protein VKX16_20040 [Chloroflexota bacterium]|nr:hypothetical protein [Chloroflexota bacterium]